MYEQIEEPQQRLAKEIIPVLRWRAIISTVIELVIVALIYALSLYFTWHSFLNFILLTLVILIFLYSIWEIGLKPRLTYKNTRYAVNEEFLQLKRGAFNEVNELVPIAKIQAVSTNQGPILRRFGLYSISIETMGSVHGIIGLEKELAIKLRNKIAHFAKITEVDE